MDKPLYELVPSKQYEKWFKKLAKSSPEIADLIAVRLLAVKTGHFGEYRYLGEKVSELKFGVSLRIYYSIRKDNTVVLLLAGGNKDEQETNIRAAKKINKEISDEAF